MKNKVLTEFFDLPITYHRSFVSFGGVTGAVFLSQMVYWSKRTSDNEGWFWKTIKQWEDETGLTRSEQETARKRLLSCGVITEKKEGMPSKIYFKVNFDKIHELLDAIYCKHGCRIPANKDVGFQQTWMQDSCRLSIQRLQHRLYTDIYSDNAAHYHPIDQKISKNYKNDKFGILSRFKAYAIKNDADTQKTKTTAKNGIKTGLKGHKKQKDDEQIKKQLKKESTNNKKWLEMLVDKGVEQDLAKKLVEIRTYKRLKMGQLEFDYLVKQADIARLSIADVVSLCVSNNWAGFKASYVANKGFDNSKKASILDVAPNLYHPEGGMFKDVDEREAYYSAIARVEQEERRKHYVYTPDDDEPF
jgi:hypothetical protein